ncbi:MAG: 3-phosphoshikimate 1-carboxyvinyltransferase [Clostridia bacterium]|nr:3-phosphoshikimate 1-carboxyvinyltransferase [Clostridia bacterium]
MRVIKPRTQFEGEFTLPGDKSVTHRALMLNAVSRGEAIVTNALTGEDSLSTARCMRELGAKIEQDGTTFRVVGRQELLSEKTLDCGNSATTMRLLTGLLSGKGVKAKLYGDKSLSSRPMARVAEPLSLLGAKIKTSSGKPPVELFPVNLIGVDVRLEISSAQVKSAVLLAGVSAEGETRVSEPIKSRDHTERMLKNMGADLRVEGNTVTVKKSSLNAVDVEVPADISSATYFMALGALKGKTLCKNVGVNATRTGILRAFDKLGVKYSLLNRRICSGEDIADILVEKSNLKGIELDGADVPSMIDELPLIALLCAFADGESHIRGAQELKIKESDRISATAELINGLGGACIPTEDGFIIQGKKTLLGGEVNSRFDHRIAMTGAVALLASKNGGVIHGAESCAVSFPNFFENLEV